MSEGCPLCKAERLTRWYHEDGVCWVADCSSHPDKKIIVLRHHSKNPTPLEEKHMKKLAERLFPDKRWRGPKSILDHYHLHEK